MAWTIEKDTADVVINGWEKGIAPSPHEGIANLQCANISTEMGEVLCNYARVKETQNNATGGTFTGQNGLSTFQITNTGGAGSILPGIWLHITSDPSNVMNGNSYVYVMDEGSRPSLFLSTSYKGNGTGGEFVANATGTVTFSTVNMNLPVASAIEDLGGGNYNFYVLDQGNATTGVQVWLRPSGAAKWYGLRVPAADVLTNATGLAFFPGVSQTYYAGGNSVNARSNSFLVVLEDDNSSVKNCVVASTVNIRLSTFGGFSAFSAFAPTTVGIHSELYGHDNVVYGLDGQNIMSLQPKFPSTCGIFTSTGSGTVLTATNFSAGIGFQINMPIVLTTSGALPTGLSVGTTYYIISVSGNTFQISTSVGGSAVSTSSVGSGTQGFTSVYFQPVAGTLAGTTISGEPQSYTANLQALSLPSYETALSIAELGVNLMIGGKTNNLYPWDRTPVVSGQGIVSNSYNYPILLPEANIQQLLTVNNLLYCFAGSKGNIYITNGQTATGALSVPDYVTGQIEPYFSWGATMYGRGRVWFSVQQGSGTSNVGGVWSFVPSTNFFVGQDVGASLRLEHQNSYGTYSGYASVLLLNPNQAAQGIQYFSGWTNGSGTTFGIDNSDTTPYTGGQTLIETDLIETGTFLKKRTFSNIEFKFAAPLVSGESIAINFRTDINGTWTPLTGQVVENSLLSGYYTVDFEKSQWVQFQVLLTSTGTNPTFARLTELRIR